MISDPASFEPEPERLDHFMARANAAYYAARDPFADFTTGPEIGQMFGEIMGALLATLWAQMGAPDPVLLVEAGPGRGTLMADALRALRRVAPDFVAAARLHLIESSPRLRAVQAARLPGAVFHAGLDTLPPGTLLLLGNEFLDALPIRQFVRQAGGCRERYVQAGRFVTRAATLPAGLMLPEAQGAVVAYPQVAERLIGALAGRLVAEGGTALFVDYGPANSGPGDSLQAVRAGRPADPLAAPGEADLTAHVDFAALAATARAEGADVYGPIAQGKLLERLGLFLRARHLAARLKPAEALALMRSAERLAAPEHMGSLFKVLLIAAPGLPPPPGFAP